MAGGPIGSLAVNVVAKTDLFRRGMRGARQELTLFQSVVGGLSTRMLGFGAALGAGLTAHSAIAGLRQVANEMDQISKQAATLGISTEALSQLGRAADLAGVSSQQLGTAMSYMERNIEKGGAAFKRLRLEAEFLERLKPELQFMKIADAIKKIPSPGGRLQAARDIFGRGGEAMMPLMLGGSEKIGREMAIHPGFSGEAGVGAENMNDSFTRLKHSLSDVAMTMVEKFGPAIEKAANTLNNLLGGADFEGVTKWSKELDKLSDAQFGKFVTQWERQGSSLFGGSSTAQSDAGRKFLGVKNAHMASNDIDAAIRERQMKMSERFQEMEAGAFTANKKRNAGFSTGGLGFFGAGSGAALETAITSIMSEQRFESGAMSMAALSRLENWISEQALENMPREEATPDRRFGEGASRGFSALEAGSAEAFMQDRRSRDQNKHLNVAEKQLKQEEEQTKALRRIDKNLQALDSTLPANLS